MHKQEVSVTISAEQFALVVQNLEEAGADFMQLLAETDRSPEDWLIQILQAALEAKDFEHHGDYTLTLPFEELGCLARTLIAVREAL